MIEDKSELTIKSETTADLENNPLIQPMDNRDNSASGFPMQYYNPFATQINPQVIVSREIFSGKYWSVFKLINEGKLPADLLVDPNNNWYLIHFLITTNKPYKLKVLLELFKADPNIIDKFNQTPLHMAITHLRCEEIVVLTEDKRTEIEKRDILNCTPLLNCAKRCFIHGFIYLYLEKNCDVNVRDTNGFSIAHWSAIRNHEDFLKILVHIPDCDFSCTSNDDLLPIESAISGMSYNATKVLLSTKNANDTPEQLRKYMKSLNNHPHIESLLREEITRREINQCGVSSFLSHNPGSRVFIDAVKYLYDRNGRGFFLAFFILFNSLLTIAFYEQYPLLSITGFGFELNLILLFISLKAFLTQKDPGYIHKKLFSDHTNCIGNILDKFKKGEIESEAKFCFSCLIIKPRSAYHCYRCNKCVMGYHMHLKNSLGGVCIGTNNFSPYFFCQLFSVIMLIFYLFGVISSAMDQPTSIFPISIIERYCALYYKGKFEFAVTMIATIVFLQVWYNLVVVLVAACYGMTLHELYHPNKHEYLFEIKFGSQFKGALWVPHSTGKMISNLCTFFGKMLFQKKEEKSEWRTSEELKEII